MRERRFNILIPGLILAIIGLIGAYALFGEVLYIGGTAGTTGEFDIQFLTATTSDVVGSNPTATISVDRKTLTINVEDLEYPGAGAQIDIVVKNVGTISAILRTITITGNDDPDIVVELIGVEEDIPIDAGEEYPFAIRVYWSSQSTTGDKSINFTVELGYEQNTGVGY